MPKTDVDDLRRLAISHYIWPLLSREEIDEVPPLILTDGEGARLRDVEGNEYLDMMGSMTRASTLGYSRGEIIDAMHKQLLRLPYAGVGHVADVTVQLAATLAELTPGDLVSTSFSGSGSEANETAFKLAQAYHQANEKPRAYKLISRWNAYHGAVGSAMAVSDWLDVRHPSEPGVPGVSAIPAPTCYRCPFNLEYPGCGMLCADYLEQEILYQGPELVAAFIAEPVMQADGVQVPPPGYFARILEICHQYDVLFIGDEVITGFGRTGAWFAFDHWDVEPDIMTMAKGLTAGYAPLGATIISSQLRGSLARLADVHTFGGHATACAAALEAIAIYEREELPERARIVGAQLLERLQEFEQFKIVGDVRGIGMWLAVDFTADPATRAPMEDRVLKSIAARARDLGVIVSRNGTAIELAPPLTIDLEEALAGIDLFERAVAEADQEPLS